MEAERKRKRQDDAGGVRRQQEIREIKEKKEGVQKVVEKGEAVVVASSPTQEEVDEFFAILRKMHVAIKYFQRSGGGGNGDGHKLKELLGTASVTEVKNVKTGGERSVNGGLLDLNALPESESYSV